MLIVRIERQSVRERVSTHRETLGGENDDLSATVHINWISMAEKGNGCDTTNLLGHRNAKNQGIEQ